MLSLLWCVKVRGAPRAVTLLDNLCTTSDLKFKLSVLLSCSRIAYSSMAASHVLPVRGARRAIRPK